MKITKSPQQEKYRTGLFMPRRKWSDWICTLFLSFLVIGCSSGTQKDSTESDSPESAPKTEAQIIVDRAIDYAGGDLYNHSEVSFLFRDRAYTAWHNRNGKYEYTREWEDSTGTVRDVLNNDGFYREIEGKKVDVIDSMAAKYARSVNSVIYFALLPDALNDPAVVKELLGKEELKGNTYDKIKVTFRQEGGGKDFEDEFIYWFDENTGQMDYMGYLYFTDDGGMRFREGYNMRVVNGLRFYDFINFLPADSIKLENIADAYLDDELEILSRIELENIKVSPLED